MSFFKEINANDIQRLFYTPMHNCNDYFILLIDNMAGKLLDECVCVYERKGERERERNSNYIRYLFTLAPMLKICGRQVRISCSSNYRVNVSWFAIILTLYKHSCPCVQNREE